MATAPGRQEEKEKGREQGTGASGPEVGPPDVDCSHLNPTVGQRRSGGLAKEKEKRGRKRRKGGGKGPPPWRHLRTRNIVSNLSSFFGLFSSSEKGREKKKRGKDEKQNNAGAGTAASDLSPSHVVPGRSHVGPPLLQPKKKRKKKEIKKGGDGESSGTAGRLGGGLVCVLFPAASPSALHFRSAR